MTATAQPHLAFSDHARRRFAERYRLCVTADDLRGMVACIRRGEAVLLKGDETGCRAVYATPRPSRKGKRNKLAPVVYDRRFDAIVTVLPETKLLAYRDVIAAFRAKRVAERGADAWPLRMTTIEQAAARRQAVRLALDVNKLCFHVHCETSVCPFPVSLYVRDITGHCGNVRRREVVYLKANGFAASSATGAIALLRQQFRTCMAVRTGSPPPNTQALTDSFLDKLADALRREQLTWARPATPAKAA